MKKNVLINTLLNIFKDLLLIVVGSITFIGGIILFSITFDLMNKYDKYIFYSISNIGVISLITGIVLATIMLLKFIRKLINIKDDEVGLNNLDDEVRDIDLKKWQIKLIKFEEAIQNNKGTVNLIISTSILVLIFIGYTNFNVITDKKIIIKRTFYTKEYSYEDVSNIITGITKDKDNNLYYNLQMKDGRKVNLITGIIDSKDEAYEVSVYNIDNNLLKLGVNKEVDRSNVDKFIKKGYDDQYQANVLNIFEYTP